MIVTPSGEGKQYLKGTGRSIEGVNLYALLKHHEHLFEKFTPSMLLPVPLRYCFP